MDDSQKFLAIAAKIRTLEKRLNEARQEVVKIEKQVGPSGPPGRDGKDGINGIDGRNGIDGKDGRDGQDGKDGISVSDVSLDLDGTLKFQLSDGSEISTQMDLNTFVSNGSSVTLKQQYSGAKVFVQSTQPTGASVGDVWIQTA